MEDSHRHGRRRPVIDGRPGSPPPERDGSRGAEGETIEPSTGCLEIFEHHPDDGTFLAVFDGTATSPSTAVVAAVAAVAGKDPTEVDPVYSTVDPTALDALVGRSADRNGDVHVHLSIEGYDVEVTSNGRIGIRPTRSTGTPREP